MSTVVKLLNSNEIKTLLGKYPFETTGLPDYMTARLKRDGHMISVYSSNKVMVQGSNAESIAAEMLPGDPVAKPSAKTAVQKSTIQYDQFNCIGSDEAGSGDYFGPMTVVASYVSSDHAKVLKELGVMDSKNLKDPKIIALAEQIITFLPHSLLVLDNPKYNERKAIGWSQVKMKAVLHNQAILNVLGKIEAAPIDYIVIDQFAVEGVYKNYAGKAIPQPEKTKFETKGESKSIAIAASSIIARYAFVKWMDHIESETGITIIKGAGPKVDMQAAKVIEKKGIAYLDSITKKDFKNRAKALTLIERKKQS